MSSNWRERIDRLRAAQDREEARRQAEIKRLRAVGQKMAACRKELCEYLAVLKGLVVRVEDAVGPVHVSAGETSVVLHLGTAPFHRFACFAIEWDEQEDQPVITPAGTQHRFDLLGAVEYAVALVEKGFVGDEAQPPPQPQPF